MIKKTHKGTVVKISISMPDPFGSAPLRPLPPDAGRPVMCLLSVLPLFIPLLVY